MEDSVYLTYVPPPIEEEPAANDTAKDTAKNETESATNQTIPGDSTDFGELEDDFGENSVFIPTMANWVRPKPRAKLDASGQLITPPPVTIDKSEMSESGGLAIEFKRPVIVPPFFEGKGKRADETFRLLQEGDEANKPPDVNEYLYDIMEFKVISTFFDEGSDEILINKLELIEFTATKFEIQITFKNTGFISASLTEPDIIEIRFKKTDIFID